MKRWWLFAALLLAAAVGGDESIADQRSATQKLVAFEELEHQLKQLQADHNKHLKALSEAKGAGRRRRRRGKKRHSMMPPSFAKAVEKAAAEKDARQIDRLKHEIQKRRAGHLRDLQHRIRLAKKAKAIAARVQAGGSHLVALSKAQLERLPPSAPTPVPTRAPTPEPVVVKLATDRNTMEQEMQAFQRIQALKKQIAALSQGAGMEVPAAVARAALAKKAINLRAPPHEGMNSAPPNGMNVAPREEAKGATHHEKPKVGSLEWLRELAASRNRTRYLNSTTPAPTPSAPKRAWLARLHSLETARLAVLYAVGAKHVGTGDAVKVNDGHWHHIALVYSEVKATAQIFVDGYPSIPPMRLESHADPHDFIAQVGFTNDDFPHPVSYLHGDLAEVKVWDAGLSPSEASKSPLPTL
eukprot:g3761.t1